MKYFIFLSLFLLTTQLSAANYFLPDSIGTNAKMISTGSQGLGFGSAQIFENPGSVEIKSFSVSGFKTTLMNDFEYSNTAIGIKTPLGNLSAGFLQLSTSDIPHTTLATNPIYNEEEISVVQSYSYRNIIGKLGLTVPINEFIQVGTNLSFLYTELFNTYGKGFNADFGTRLNLNPLTLSLAFKNLLPTDVTYNDKSKENIPYHFLMASQYRFNDQLSLFGQLQLYESNLEQGYLKNIGLKADLLPTLFYIATSYKEFFVLDQRKKTWAFGFGLTLSGLSLDYAFEKSDYPPTDNNYYFSIGVDI